MVPRGPDRCTTVLLAFALLIFFNTMVADAQVFDLEGYRVPVTVLNDAIRFHIGDDPRWADPGFDDSSWSLVYPWGGWSQYGYGNYSGVAWYRFQVRLPREHRPFSILFGEVFGSYQVFSDGHLIGEMGQLPPHEQPYFDAGNVYRLTSETDPGKPITIAVRVWCWRQWAGNGGLRKAPLVGDSDLLEQWLRKDQIQYLWGKSAANYQAAIQLMAGLAGLGLFLLRKKEREYLWFGFFEIFAAVKIILNSTFWAHSHPVKSYLVSVDAANLAASLCFLAFLSHICGLRRTRLFWAAATWAAIDLVLLLSAVKEWIYLYRWWETVTIMEIPYALFALFIVFRGMRFGNPDARLVLVPVGLDSIVRFLTSGSSAMHMDWVPNVPWLQRMLGSLQGNTQVASWPFPVTLSELTVTLIQFSILAILIMRFARSRRDEERFKTEFEAARAVQQVLIPDDIPSVPGFQVEGVYKPAGEVAGDFFQVFALKDHGALVVIGDVSGKGLPAAMTVSLLVGTVRTLAHFWQNPRQILGGMNQRMLTRSKDGFTTCLVVRVGADGRVTAANAGHLAPYVNGREVPIQNGLPLGLVPGVEYEETQFILLPGEQLTVMTDGVVEAQSRTQELFGFERAAALAAEPAERIVEAAVAFGQQDDVTVVTLRLVGAVAGEPHNVMGLASSET